MEYLTNAQFRVKIFDYQNKQEWENQNDKPVLIDFYADWCGPCTMLTPILENMEKNYGDRVDFFKVDADQEQELLQAFGVQSLPTMLFIPKEGQPQMAKGAVQPDKLKQAIEEILLNESVNEDQKE